MIITTGLSVFLEYEGKFENGEVFDSSESSAPLEFVAGAGQVISGFDGAVIGMKIGEEKEFEIEPKDGYGEINEELKKEIPKSALPKEHDPKVGMTLIMNTPTGQQIPAKISKVTDENVVIDLNHPLAGKKLIFKIKIVDIKEAAIKEEEEIKENVDKTINKEIEKDISELKEVESEKDEEKYK